MSRLLPKLRIIPPTGPLPPGRGFYQLEESALYIPIGIADPSPFFSYLESNLARFDINQRGELIFAEISASRHTWKVKPDLAPPTNAEPAELRWLDFRTEMAEPTLLSNRNRSLLGLQFSDEQPARTLQIAESVLVQLTQDSTLVSLWVTEIVDDLAGQEIARFREALRKETAGSHPQL